MPNFRNDKLYFKWLGAESKGFVLNTRPSPTTPYRVLHDLSCWTIRKGKNYSEGAFTEHDYIKICSTTIPELRRLMIEHGFTDGKWSRICGTCKPIVADEDEIDIGAKAKNSQSSVGAARKGMLKLQAYFNEYAGQGHTKGHSGGERTVEHGNIVEALEALRRNTGISEKAQAIDLAVVTTERVDLFEVKTSARTTDVYTGVGQLLIHGECIADLLKRPVRRYLVLPERPHEAHEPHIVRKGDISIVTFLRVNGKYVFAGI
jgi:hypothetical protein